MFSPLFNKMSDLIRNTLFSPNMTLKSGNICDFNITTEFVF